MTFDDYDIERQVLDFMEQNGIHPALGERLILDGQRHRLKLSGDKSGEKSGAYKIYTDNLPAGWVQDWHLGDPIKWHYDTSALDDERRKYFADPKIKAQTEAKRKAREAAELAAQNKAADTARIRFETLPPAPENFPYLQKKQVYPYGVKLDTYNNTDKAIAIPLRDIRCNVRSIQWILADGGKRFFPDAPLTGLFWAVGLDTANPSDFDGAILLGEGYATMAKLYELTGRPCVAGLFCSHLKNIADVLHKEYPKAKIIVMADNDKGTELKRDFNPGIDAAKQIVKAGLAVDFLAPDFANPNDGSDWDDYALLHGDQASADLLKDKISWASFSEKEKKELAALKALEGISHSLDPRINLPPQEFIGGMFPRKFVSLLIAPPGTGKTIFMQKFVSDVSIGGSVFDGFAEDEPVRKCLILAGEAGYELLIRRGAAMQWPINPQQVKVIDQYEAEIKNISVMLDDSEGWENILRLVKLHNPDIVFIDTLSSFHEKDENKATDMKPIIKRLSSLARDKNIAVVPVHHSRKRLAKDRALSLNQDDVIGSSIINRLVGLIVGIEPMKDDEKSLLVRPLKSWFSTFMPFTYTLKEGLYGGTIVQTDLAPASVNNSKIAVWNYLRSNFALNEWFTKSQIIPSEIEGHVTEWHLKRILTDFVKTGKLQKRGATKFSEYSLAKNYSSED